MMNKSDAVAKALPDKRKKHRRVIWISVTAGVLAVAILLAVLFPFPSMFGKSSDSSTRSRTTKKRTEETEITHEGYRMAQPEYPEMPLNPSLSEFEDSDERMEKRDEWEAVVQSLRAQPSGYKDGYMEYYKDVLPVLLQMQEKKTVSFLH